MVRSKASQAFVGANLDAALKNFEALMDQTLATGPSYSPRKPRTDVALGSVPAHQTDVALPFFPTAPVVAEPPKPEAPKPEEIINSYGKQVANIISSGIHSEKGIGELTNRVLENYKTQIGGTTLPPEVKTEVVGQLELARKEALAKWEKTYSTEEVVKHYKEELAPMAFSGTYTNKGVEVLSKRVLGNYQNALKRSGLSKEKQEERLAALENARQDVISEKLLYSFSRLVPEYSEDANADKWARKVVEDFKKDVIPNYSLSETNKEAVIKEMERASHYEPRAAIIFPDGAGYSVPLPEKSPLVQEYQKKKTVGGNKPAPLVLAEEAEEVQATYTKPLNGENGTVEKFGQTVDAIVKADSIEKLAPYLPTKRKFSSGRKYKPEELQEKYGWNKLKKMALNNQYHEAKSKAAVCDPITRFFSVSKLQGLNVHDEYDFAAERGLKVAYSRGLQALK